MAIVDFFVSYNRADKAWAEWIAWQVEAAGYTTMIQAWDFGPGSNFVHEMQTAAAAAERTIAVLSPDYLTSQFTAPEWYAAFAQDPTGTQRKLLPIRVRKCDLVGLLPQIVYVDLVEVDESAALDRLLAALSGERQKPNAPPPHPKQNPNALQRSGTGFPGTETNLATSTPSPSSQPDDFDVFLSHHHSEAAVVEHLGHLLRELGFRVWLDKWVLIPGNHWQRDMADGLARSKTCAVCVGRDTPSGWFAEELELALNRHARDHSFRVIPTLLPDGKRSAVDNFLALRTWADFSNGIDDHRALHVLKCGIRGEPPGPPENVVRTRRMPHEGYKAQLMEIQQLREDGLIDNKLENELKRRILKKRFS